jgi:hypothetical protein
MESNDLDRIRQFVWIASFSMTFSRVVDCCDYGPYVDGAGLM